MEGQKELMDASLSFWLRRHLKALLLRTELASCNISWDSRSICSALEPATEDGNASLHLGPLQRSLGKLFQCFTCCIGTSSAVRREGRGRNKGHPSSGTTNVSHTQLGWSESGISITAASGTRNLYRAQEHVYLLGQNHSAPNCEPNSPGWS